MIFQFKISKSYYIKQNVINNNNNKVKHYEYGFIKNRYLDSNKLIKNEINIISTLQKNKEKKLDES